MENKFFKNLRSAYLIAVYRLKGRYYYSRIGVFIEPITTLIWVFSLTVLFGSSRDITYLGLGVVTFRFLSESVANGCFIKFRLENLFLNFGTKDSEKFFWSSFLECYLLFILNTIIICPIFFYFGDFSFGELLFGGIAMIVLSPLFCCSLFILFFASATFFPMTQTAVRPVLRLLFFASPIFWGVSDVSNTDAFASQVRILVYQVNPFAWMMELVRFFFGYPLPTVLHMTGFIAICSLITLSKFLGSHTFREMKRIKWPV